MTSEKIPQPTVMPVDREMWATQLHLSNFVNTYYQYRDLQACVDCKRVLIIGPGQGLDTVVLRWRGYEVETLDIDDTFTPNHVGSVHDLRMFKDGQFDAVIASHVLEHLAEPYLNPSLREISRVGRFALIYLPVHGRHVQARFVPGFRGLNLSFVLDLFNYAKKPPATKPSYADGQHFWEVGMRGFRVRDLLTRMSPFFDVRSHYRNQDWLPSHNFVLESKRHAG